jgi:hypothetical protein
MKKIYLVLLVIPTSLILGSSYVYFLSTPVMSKSSHCSKRDGLP